MQGHEHVSPDCRVRIPLRLRGERAGRAGRRGRVAVPAASRLSERVRRVARPVGGVLPVRAIERRRPAPTALPAGHADRRDQLAHTDGLADGAGPARARAVRRRRASSSTDACRATNRRRARCSASPPARAAASRCTLNCLPLFDYGRTQGEWSYEGQGYDRLAVTCGDLSLELASSLRLGIVGARAYGRTHLDKDESAFVALSWGGQAPDDARRGVRAARADRELLA